jgi:hypothetical protein
MSLLLPQEYIKTDVVFTQGEKTIRYSMTVFNMYKQQLSTKFNVNFISYQNLNHMFTVSVGEKSTPAVYNII